MEEREPIPWKRILAGGAALFVLGFTIWLGGALVRPPRVQDAAAQPAPDSAQSTVKPDSPAGSR